MLDRVYQGFLRRINEGTVSPWLVRALWKGVYQVLARSMKDESWTFMNYGWLPPADEPPFALDPADEPDRCFIGLYHRLATQIPLEGLRVLEVGSGRGGGASWLARTYRPAEMVGIDFSPRAVTLCRRLHRDVPNLRFLEGDAVNLPFPDSSFDAVINVESSHCYGDMPRFVAEVARVLKPGGRFGWADIRGPDMVAATERALAHPLLEPIAAERINDGVVRALDAAHARKAALIDRLRFGRAAARQFAGARGSLIYDMLRKGTTPYLLKVLERRPSPAAEA